MPKPVSNDTQVTTKLDLRNPGEAWQLPFWVRLNQDLVGAGKKGDLRQVAAVVTQGFEGTYKNTHRINGICFIIKPHPDQKNYQPYMWDYDRFEILSEEEGKEAQKKEVESKYPKRNNNHSVHCACVVCKPGSVAKDHGPVATRAFVGMTVELGTTTSPYHEQRKGRVMSERGQWYGPEQLAAWSVGLHWT